MIPVLTSQVIHTAPIAAAGRQAAFATAVQVCQIGVVVLPVTYFKVAV